MDVWYWARGAGLAALVLLSVSTALGALVSKRGPAGRRYVAQYVHRTAAGLGLAVLALHITLILADSYAGVGWVGALVPFESGYRPTWVAFGTLAAYLFVIVSISGLARGRLTRSVRATRAWRCVHGLAYLGWVAAMWHGFFTGTDSDLGWTRVVYLACLALVLGATAWRVGTGLAARGRGDRLAGAAPITASRLVATNDYATRTTSPTATTHLVTGGPR